MPTPLDPELVDQIRTSLYSGRGVRLSGNDSPTTMLEPSTEMTAEGDAFFTGKLDKIAELLDRGFVVNIDSQGAILATTPDHRSRYISTQETDIDVMDRLMVKQALEQGSKVSIERDGSLVIDAVADAAVPTAEVAAARFAEFERLADSGQINSELAEGRDFQFDESAVPMAPPENDNRLEDPFDTAAELEAEAEALQLGVDAARDRMLPEFANDKETAEIERVAAEGRLAMTKAEDEMALQQAVASGEAAASAAQGAADQRALAQQFRDAGDEARAEASETDATNLDAVEAVHRNVERAALAVADAARERVTTETEAVQSATLASAAVNARYSELDQALDEQQEQVSGARLAAAELAEAERLEAALPDLEARGVEGTERIRAAIAEHRAAAEVLVQQAELRETTDITVTCDEFTGEMPAAALVPDEVMPDDVNPDKVLPDDSVPDEVLRDDDAATGVPDDLLELDPRRAVVDPLVTDVEEFAAPVFVDAPSETSDFAEALSDVDELASAADSVFDDQIDL